MLGYFNNEEATEAVLQDRWLKTGDLGKLDEDGNLFIVGRSKDVIIDRTAKIFTRTKSKTFTENRRLSRN